MSSFPVITNPGGGIGPGTTGDQGSGGPAQTDETPQYGNLIRTSPQVNSKIQHDLGRLLLNLLLRIFPQTDIKTELADHGLKAEPDTPEAVLQSEQMRRLAVRPQQVPFAEADLNPGYLNPRRSLRVSR